MESPELGGSTVSVWEAGAQLQSPDEINGSYVTAIGFDSAQSLFWTGYDTGRITAYWHDAAQPDQPFSYTSLRAHDGPVLGIKSRPSDGYLLSVGQSSLRLANQRGMTLYQHRAQPAEVYTCMSTANNRLVNDGAVVAQSTGTIQMIDFEKQVVARSFYGPFFTNVVEVFETNTLVAASSSGIVSLFDVRTIARIHEPVKLHSVNLAGCAIGSNGTIYTCGTSEPAEGDDSPIASLERFDIRAMKTLPRIVTEDQLSHIAILPANEHHGEALVSATFSGYWSIASLSSITLADSDATLDGLYSGDIGLPEDVAPTAMSTSASGQLVAIGDNLGTVCTFYDAVSKRAVVSESGECPTEWAEPEQQPLFDKPMSVDGNEPLSTIGMPRYSGQLLSAWPPNLVFQEGTEAPQIGPNILSRVRWNGYIGNVPQQPKQRSNKRRNQSHLRILPSLRTPSEVIAADQESASASAALTIGTPRRSPYVPARSPDPPSVTSMKLSYQQQHIKSTDMPSPRFLSEQVSSESKGSSINSNNYNNSGSGYFNGSEIQALSKSTAQQRKQARADRELSQLELNGMPRYYRNIEIKISRFGIDDYDFEYYNNTTHSGLENLVPNSYANALFQALYCTPLLGDIARLHASASGTAICSEDTCLLCELWFLFKMLQDANGRNCHASNILRAINLTPAAASLNVFEPIPPTADTSYGQMTMRLFELITSRLNLMAKPPASIAKSHEALFKWKTDSPIPANIFSSEGDLSNTSNTSSNHTAISQLYGLEFKGLIECECGAQTSTDTRAFTVELATSSSMVSIAATTASVAAPLAVPALSTSSSILDGVSSTAVSPSASMESLLPATSGPEAFCSAVEQSLSVNRPMRIFCKSCKKHVDHVKYSNTLTALPRVLVITCPPLLHEGFESALANVMAIAAQSNDINPPATNLGIIPKLVRITVKTDGVAVEAVDANSDTQIEESDLDSAIYELSSVVCEVLEQDKPSHMVTIGQPLQEQQQQQQSAGDGDSQNTSSDPQSNKWMLFNDFLVRPIPEDETLRVWTPWKRPTIITFARRDIVTSASPALRHPLPIDFSALLQQPKLTKNKKVLFVPLVNVELPHKGMICALDAEFVMLDKGDSELRSDGTSIVIKPDRKALARLSIVRGNIDSPLFSVPFVDDYIIAVEPVADYVTRYSGIRRNDLTPNKSKYHLVSRKTAYCKLRTLIDAGCIFVGHGLRNDLRVLNVFVPPDQLIDTSTLFQSKQHRRIVSLRFLVWFLFNEDIQRSEHDSIVDAQSTLKVYTEYKKLVEVGQFEETLERLYRAGNELGWVPQAPHKA